MKIIAVFSILGLTAAASFAQNSASVTAQTGATLSNQEKVITTPSGLQYVDYKVGTGVSPKPEQTVVVNCVGRLKDSTIFWSTLDPKFGPVQPLTSPLANLIGGWKEGLLTMKVGGKRKLIIPYTLAYGEQGRPPVIPPKSDLVFEIELLDVK